MNNDMKKAVDEGEAIDIRTISTEVRPGVFELRPGTFKEGMDYCDTLGDRWIWSIGVDKTTGKTYAGVTGEFYEDPKYNCIWLR